MKLFRSSFSFVLAGTLSLLSFLFFVHNPVFAGPLQWNLTKSISSNEGGNTEIRVADSSKGIIFASNRKSDGTFDLLKSVDHGLTWKSVKNNITLGADANWISIQRTNSQVVAISVWGQGIYLSEDGGETWSLVFSHPFPRSVAIDPSSSNSILAGVTDSSPGLFKTSDKGLNWQTLLGGNSVTLSFDPTSGGRVLADAGGSLFLSLNSGNTWTSLPAPTGGYSSSAFDISDPSVYYVTLDYGLFKTIDNGATWSLKTNGIGNGFFFRVAQEENGFLYTTVQRGLGGLWRSKDGANTWENISGPGWSNKDTWGMDVKDGRIYVGVAGEGIYIANTDGSPLTPPPAQAVVCDNLSVTPNSGNTPLEVTATLTGHTINGGSITGYRFDFGDGSGLFSVPGNLMNHVYNSLGIFTVNGYVVDNLGHVAGGSGSCQATVTTSSPPPPGPKPVVFIPGFGGSWSYKGLIQNKPTTYADWQLLPRFTDYFYRPLINTLQAAGLPMNEKLFVFAYDYRKSISDSASWLNDYLATEVIPKNSGKKVNIAAHSMGGLVARYCFEKISGCANKIDKIVTGGSPHQGTLEAYEFWEGGKIAEKDLLTRFAERLLLHVSGFPKIRSIDIIQNTVPGVRDVLPIFDYIVGKPYFSLSPLAKNPKLESLQAATPALNAALVAFSGTDQRTPKMFEVFAPSFIEKIFGFWTDGKPRKTITGNGDQTVLKTSSEVLTAQNRYYSVKHGDYFNNTATLTDLLSIFGLAGSPVITLPVQSQSFQVVYSSEGAEVSAQDQNGKSVGQISDGGKVIFLDREVPNLKVKVKGNKDTDYKINRIFVNLESEPEIREFKGFVKKDQFREHSL